MSGQTEPSWLATVEAFEAAAFRVAQVTRKLLAEHPGIPVWDIRPRVITQRDYAMAQLEISAKDTDAVRAWADALGVTVKIIFHDGKPGIAFEYHEAACTVSGVEVSAVSTRRLSEEEIAAWHKKQDLAGQAPGGAS